MTENRRTHRGPARHGVAPVVTAAWLLAMVAIPAPLAADPPACAQGAAAIELGPRSASADWSAPLDRIVSLYLDGGTLGAALDRLSRETNVRFSYSTEFVAADRLVCIALTSVPLGDALRELVRAAAVDPGDQNLVHPAVAEADHVVLAPVAGALVRPVSMPSPDQVVRLERIVVTGEPGDVTSSALRSGLVIDADRIAALGFQDLGSVLASVVPGFRDMSSGFEGMGSLPSGSRGATSFFETPIAVYIDGVRVSDAHAIATIPPESVERIEVIRGPAGAVLFGAEAMDGIIHIRSRSGRGVDDRRGLQFRSTAGLGSDDPVATSSLSHNHVLTGWLGSPTRSAAFSLSGGESGDAIPGTSSRYLAGFGNGHAGAGSSTFTATARASYARSRAEAHLFANGLLPVEGSPARKPDASPLAASFFSSGSEDDQSLLSYTLGVTASFGTSERWTHSIVAGIDGYRAEGSTGAASPAISRHTVSLPAGGGAGDRLTVRGTSRLDAVMTEEVDGDLFLVADYSRFREGGAGLVLAPRGEGGAPYVRHEPLPGPFDDLSRGYSAAGVGLQAAASVHDRLFLDAGLRLQANQAEGSSADVRVLPMLGTSLELAAGPVESTLRAAWGAGVRSSIAGVGLRTPAGSAAGVAIPTTQEEMVSGFEAGLEVRVADFFMIGLTHFDQRTTGPVSTALGSARYTPFARNAGFLATGSGSGEITGAGWEATSSIMLGAIAVNAALATVDSRIARLPAGFAIGLREGDRMPHVPAVTSGIGASWTTPRGSLSVTASRAWNWLSYDHGAHGRSDSAAPRSGEGEGRNRPGGWISFDSGTLLDAGASFAVRPELSILWGVENLLGDRSPQPLNAAPASGRNFFLGLRATF